MAKERPPKAHPDQQHFEGTAPERNEDVHAAARAYKKVRDHRIKASLAEKIGKEKLIETMQEAGVAVYVDPDGYTVTVDIKKNVHLSETDEKDE